VGSASVRTHVAEAVHYRLPAAAVPAAAAAAAAGPLFDPSSTNTCMLSTPSRLSTLTGSAVTGGVRAADSVGSSSTQKLGSAPWREVASASSSKVEPGVVDWVWRGRVGCWCWC